MKLISLRIVTAFTVSLSVSISSFAYNFVYTNFTGQPIKWDNSRSILYYLDPDPLPGYTLEQTYTLLQEAIKLWEEVPTAKVPRFEFAGYLPEDVNKDNYSLYVDRFTCYTESLEYCNNVEVHKNLRTVIIIDSDNWLLDHVFSPIIDASAIAGAMTFEGALLENIEYIVQGYVVFGAPIGNYTADTVAWLTHELGHLLGLGHTSLSQKLFYVSDIGVDRDVFFPTMETGSSTSTYMSEGATLNPDDIAGISVLYPSDTFYQETVTIQGEIKKSDGTPIPKVNVVARNVEDPLCKAYSFISSRFCPHPGGSGWVCLEGPDGNYEISGLPLGDYTVEVEEIVDDPYGKGVIEAYLAGDSEFWNEGDQADEDPYKYTIISLAAGETRENVDIVLNRSTVTEDRVKFIPLDILLANFPLPATTACTDTTIDYAGLIGIDEGGDDTPTSAGCSLIIRR